MNAITKQRRAVIAKILAENPLFPPVALRRPKHLIGVDGKNHGFFVVNNPKMILDRKAYRQIVAEAVELKLDRRLFIFGRIATYIGPGIEFMQLGAG